MFSWIVIGRQNQLSCLLNQRNFWLLTPFFISVLRRRRNLFRARVNHLEGEGQPTLLTPTSWRQMQLRIHVAVQTYLLIPRVREIMTRLRMVTKNHRCPSAVIGGYLSVKHGTSNQLSDFSPGLERRLNPMVSTIFCKNLGFPMQKQQYQSGCRYCK